ncbi:MAG: GWxTD domain-containing protein [Flavobacteriales bacterium]
MNATCSIRLRNGYLALASAWLWALSALGQQAPSMQLDVLRFANGGTSPYVEVQAEIEQVLNEAEWSHPNQPFAELTIIASRGEEILHFTKTRLTHSSDPANPNNPGDQNLSEERLLHIERLPVTSGAISLEISLNPLAKEGDMVSPTSMAPQSFVLPVQMPTTEAPWFSDIMLLEAWATASDEITMLTRSGIEMLPLVGSTLSKSATEVPFYVELYGTSELVDSLFLFTAEWLDETGQPIPETTRYFRKSTASVLPVFEIMPLPAASKAILPAQLHLTAKSKHGDPIAERHLPVAFASPEEIKAESEANPQLMPFIAAFTDSITLLRHIEDHHPFGDHAEQNFIDHVLPQIDVRQMQAFLDGFWRAHAPENPESGWRNYTRAIAYVDSTYGACRRGRGARTDMGYVYLRYGPPNTIVQRHNETEYYPYEIWHYHQTRGQTNKRLIFMCPSAVAECFDMLHTDIRGETFNPDWLTILKTRENGLRITDSQLNRLNPRQNTFSREEPEDLFFNPR